MKKIAFINSHLNSGAPELYSFLSKHSYIQGCRTTKQRAYVSHYDLFQILSLRHKRDDKKAIYLDEIYYNYALSTKMDLSNFYFIHLIRSPDCLNLIKQKVDPVFVVRRYLYRLRRICEVAKRTPKSIFLTFNDLKKEDSIERIKDLLSLDSITKFEYNDETSKEWIPYDLMKKAENSYEKYLFFLKQLT